MDKCKIGTILKDRIKECGYTQEEFSDYTGVGLSTLKKYISGKTFYSIDTLDIFSNALKCSYEFLLGKSETPNGKYNDLKQLTDLSDDAIHILQEIKETHEFNPESKRMLSALNDILTTQNILYYIANFLYLDIDEQTRLEYGSSGSIYWSGLPFTEEELPSLYILKIINTLCEIKSGSANKNIIKKNPSHIGKLNIYRMRNGELEV